MTRAPRLGEGSTRPVRASSASFGARDALGVGVARLHAHASSRTARCGGHGRRLLVQCGRVVGIDLGTSNSAIAVVDEDGVPKIIPIDGGHNTMPSWAHYSKNGRSSAILSLACLYRSNPLKVTPQLMHSAYPQALSLSDARRSEGASRTP